MADYHYINATGVIVPDTAVIRQQVEAEYRAVFGQDIDLSPETPQGVLVTQEVENRDAMVRNNAELANQINPDLAGGVFLDGIWALLGGQRFAATHSLLTDVLFTGVPETIIPRGAIAETDAGDTFETTAVLVLDSNGTATGEMRALETGPVICPAGALTHVASSVLGWETVTNPYDAVPGRLTESDVQARRRRRQTLAMNTVSRSEAMISALYALPGVRSLCFRENVSDEPLTIETIVLKPHSIYVCVEGGEASEIAQALLRTKSMGAGYSGNITETVIDSISGQVYDVKFDRPQIVTLLCRVTVKNSPLDAQTLIPDSLAQFADGAISGDGLIVGGDVSPFEMASAINVVEPRLFVYSVELSTDGLTWSSQTVPIGINQVAKLNRSAVQVIIV